VVVIRVSSMSLSVAFTMNLKDLKEFAFDIGKCLKRQRGCCSV
jgi:hypothetical protein